MAKQYQKQLVAKEAVAALNRYDDVYEIKTIQQIIGYQKLDNGVIFNCNDRIQFKIMWYAPTIIRFFYSTNGRFEKDFSYAIDERFEIVNVDVEVAENEATYTLKSQHSNITIDKTTGNITIADNNDKVRFETQLPLYHYSTILEGSTAVKYTLLANEQTGFYGLGDKTWHLDMRGKTYENWCTDAFGFSKNHNALYRAIPFFIAQAPTNSYGLFFDNTYKTNFDFCESDTQQVNISADGGTLNYYVFLGESPLQIASDYVMLTGRPSLPPIWALGFHQCRWSYYPEQRVREVAANFRALKIPCDAIYLDIDYMDEYRCFTVNKKHFPDLQSLTSDLSKDGFETVVMIDPGIKVDDAYEVYSDGIENDVFCKRSNGELMVAPVWPPECVFPDFTNPKVRTWWANLYEDFYKTKQISGFWNDMNEPAVFNVHRNTFPDEVMHDFDGSPTNHKKAHNIYGMQMSRATIEGLQKWKPKQRPFLLSRATYSGGQRYVAIWTGDNFADWEHLRLANLQAQRLSLSGFSFCGSDIGGFAGTPTGELMARWLQLSVFHPLMRIHSMGNHASGSASVDDDEVNNAEQQDRFDQEPWSFGAEFTAINRSAIELRYQLLPYIYTTFYQYVSCGVPMIKSGHLLSVDLAKQEKDFQFGENLWVVPILKEGVKRITTQLPAGEWFHYQTQKKYSQKATVNVTIDAIPFFVKAGTILPIAPVRQHSKEKISAMTLNVYVTEGTTLSYLYEDAGDGYGDSLLRIFTLQYDGKTLSITQERNGDFKPDYQDFNLNFINFKPKENINVVKENFEKIIITNA